MLKMAYQSPADEDAHSAQQTGSGSDSGAASAKSCEWSAAVDANVIKCST
jgi:hypothetical protein